MIKFFRRIRQNMIKENKAIKYVLYAVGEIVLVVIGILIALQININNEANKKRATELNYLKNIKTDLELSITDLDNVIATRKGQISSAKAILGHHNGVPISNYVEFNMQCVGIYSWEKYVLSDNTFQELLNSGNLALISNASIKNLLLSLDAKYKAMKNGEEHFRYDTENLLYKAVYEKLDMDPTVRNFMYHVTNGAEGENVLLNRKNFEKILSSLEHKNGMTMAAVEFARMVSYFEEMKIIASDLVIQIDTELSTAD